MKITLLVSKTAYNYGTSLDSLQLECTVCENSKEDITAVISSVMLSSSVHAYKWNANEYRYMLSNPTMGQKELEAVYSESISYMIGNLLTFMKTADLSFLPDSYTVFTEHKRIGNYNVVTLEY